ncbi:MAG: NAD(P)/FAD-dependent oxidoreductase [Chitinispirillales bacterium]|nr:NAD(P)/FAD-dependent oxidoreductase [Chitinispirillales bacterium]
MDENIKRFDVVIVGAGPAGAICAEICAKSGLNTALIERKEFPSMPVRCGEGVGFKGMSVSTGIKPEWVLSQIDKVRFVSANDTHIEVKNIGESFCVDRTKMDRELVENAQRAGAKYFNNTYISNVEILQKSNLQFEYKCVTQDGDVFISCVLAAADGIESLIRRKTWWRNGFAPEDIESCVFAKVEHDLIEKNTIEFYTGSKIAVGGYLWVFGRGKNCANVGLGVLGKYSNAGLAKKLFYDFVDKKFPNAKITDLHCGGVPVGKYLSPLSKNGVVLAGDTAGQVNALNGGGIAYALFAGKTAGKTIVDSLKNGIVNYKKMNDYEKNWKKYCGKNQVRSYVLKTALLSKGDDFYNDVAAALKNENPEKLSYLRVFMKVFAKHPKLLLKVFFLFR